MRFHDLRHTNTTNSHNFKKRLKQHIPLQRQYLKKPLYYRNTAAFSFYFLFNVIENIIIKELP